MSTNILNAISHIVETNISNISAGTASRNQMNRQGEGLENFVKDAFSQALGIANEADRAKAYSKSFSYLGNQNNPPDFMVSSGDAVEVKKVQGAAGSLQLNSSYPKSMLSASSSMITRACRDAEKWTKKDLLYVVGQIDGSTQVKSLWMVYGDCYAADEEVYQQTKAAIIKGVQQSSLELQVTNELGKVKSIDPLGITDLRVRGMWGIESPWKVFKNHVHPNPHNRPRVVAIMSKSKFDSMPLDSQSRIKTLSDAGLTINQVDLPSPNNPANLVKSIVIDWLRT